GGDLHEPARHRLVDQRGLAAPAVGVRVDVRLLPDQDPALAQLPQQRPVGLEHLQPFEAGRYRGEAGPVVDGEDGRDAGGGADVVVVLAVRGRDLDDPGAVVGGDEVTG